MKPHEYHWQYTITEKTPYKCAEPDGHGTMLKEGFLQPGRVVWLRQTPAMGQVETSAFVEGIGVVNLQSQLLQPV